MRRLLLPLALLLLPTPVSASQGPATVRVTGRAGEVARVALPSGAALGNAGGDTAISAPGAGWAGVVVRRVDRSALPPTYYRVELYEPLLCPGRHCAPPSYFQPTGGTVDDGKGNVVLSAGTYAVTLLGEPGTRVSVTIAVRRGHGTRALTAKAQRGYQGRAFVPTADTAVHAFTRMPVARDGSGIQIGVVAAVLSPAGTYAHDLCLTRGGSESFDTVGGAAPCDDFSGEDVFFEGGGPVTNVEGGYVAMPWATGEGPVSTEDSLGVGLDATASGAYARVVGVGVMVVS